MFDLKLRLETLDTVRGLLPIDTGNLRWNATNQFGTDDRFEIVIDGTKADYMETLEEWDSPNNKHRGVFEYLVVPTVVEMLAINLNDKYYKPNENTWLNPGEGRIEGREERLLASLERQGVAMYEANTTGYW